MEPARKKPKTIDVDFLIEKAYESAHKPVHIPGLDALEEVITRELRKHASAPLDSDELFHWTSVIAPNVSFDSLRDQFRLFDFPLKSGK
jgi:hypothetical protein